MKRDSLPKNLRATLDRRKIPTKKEVDGLLKRLPPAQRQLLDHRILDASAKFRRSPFKVVIGERRRRT